MKKSKATDERIKDFKTALMLLSLTVTALAVFPYLFHALLSKGFSPLGAWGVSGVATTGVVTTLACAERKILLFKKDKRGDKR